MSQRKGARARGALRSVGRRVWMAGLIDETLSGLSRRRRRLSSWLKLMESRGGGVCQNESHE